MIAPYRARVQYSAVTTASPFLHLSTTLGIPPPQSNAIREHQCRAIEGRPRMSTAVRIRPQPSLPSTAVSSCSFPSTAATVVRGRPQPSRPSTAGHGCPRVATAVHGRPRPSTAGHGCPRVATAVRGRPRPSASGRPATAARGRREGAQNEHSVSTVLIGF